MPPKGLSYSPVVGAVMTSSMSKDIDVIWERMQHSILEQYRLNSDSAYTKCGPAYPIWIRLLWWIVFYLYYSLLHHRWDSLEDGFKLQLNWPWCRLWLIFMIHVPQNRLCQQSPYYPEDVMSPPVQISLIHEICFSPWTQIQFTLACELCRECGLCP